MMCLIDVLKAVIARSGFDPSCLQLVDDGDCRWLSYDPFGEIPLDDDWLLKSITDKEAVFVLNGFLDNETGCAYDMLCQFSRLLVDRGALIKPRLQCFYQDKDWSSYSAPQLTLSGLVHFPDAVTRIRELLDIVPEDCRDGLFLACWYCNDKRVQKKLLGKFKEWSRDPGWGGGTGEDCWLGRFLTKWTKESSFEWRSVNDVVKWAVCHNLMFR